MRRIREWLSTNVEIISSLVGGFSLGFLLNILLSPELLFLQITPLMLLVSSMTVTGFLIWIVFRKLEEIDFRRKIKLVFLGVTIISVLFAFQNFVSYYLFYVSWFIFPPYPLPAGSYFPVHPSILVKIFRSLLIAGLFGIAERSISLLERQNLRS